ncbi:MAG: AI-2E family transporter [Patulibacter minatonensis]
MDRPPVTVTVSSSTVVRVLLVVVVTIIGLAVLWELRGPIIWVLIAGLIAIALDKPVERLSRYIPRGLAILIVYIGLVLIPVTLLLLTVPPLVAEAQRLIESLPDLITSLQDGLKGSERLSKVLQDFDPLDTLKSQAAEIPARLTDVASIIGSIGLGALNSIVATLTILILSVFFVSSGGRAIRQGIELWGGDKVVLLHRIVDRTGTAVAAYFAGTLVIALVAGFTAWTAMEVLGIPYAVALAVLCGTASLIPMFGATVAAVLVGLIAAITTSWEVVLAWTGWQLAYQQIENNLIQPQIQKRTVKVPPVLTVIGVLFGSSLLGILGAIIAIPTIAAGIAIAEEWSAWMRGRASISGGDHFRVSAQAQASAEAVSDD